LKIFSNIILNSKKNGKTHTLRFLLDIQYFIEIFIQFDNILKNSSIAFLEVPSINNCIYDIAVNTKIKVDARQHCG